MTDALTIVAAVVSGVLVGFFARQGYVRHLERANADLYRSNCNGWNLAASWKRECRRLEEDFAQLALVNPTAVLRMGKAERDEDLITQEEVEI